MSLRPKYISFDCYGTLIYFEMAPVARRLYADRVAAADMDAFVADFSAYRLDEVLGAWKPYRDVVENSLRRTCARANVEYRDSDAAAVYAAVPTWGPHPDVVEPLKRVAAEYPLVILSNSMKDLIPASVTALQAPFHAVYTAEEAQAYKPRMQAFEYMLDQLGCAPEEMLHVSSSMRYDQMTAHDMGFGARAYVNRGHEPANPYYSTHEITDIGGLPGLVGL
ncbi:haloacid dehalogenase type II [Sphingomonas solaris]|uniref:Haloacid dehalogenase type II n=1 Tax=Alterirhizorhabdus solaris TaxID=2529389 RepID=A0A558QTI2_9SPHN|nr:haloacid dehalogenase type II [Sphingomonas solaris]TVV70367.1 haloacid dehalogenase type II [Sphingomonas solaris]